MKPPPPTPITHLPQYRQQPAEHEDSASARGPSSGRDPLGGHLRLVPRPDFRVVRTLDAIESAFSAHHEQLLSSLEALEGELPAMSEGARGAHEQIAFIRVGLRCLADALGELDANLVDVAARDPADDRLRPGTGGAT